MNSLRIFWEIFEDSFEDFLKVFLQKTFRKSFKMFCCIIGHFSIKVRCNDIEMSGNALKVSTAEQTTEGPRLTRIFGFGKNRVT